MLKANDDGVNQWVDVDQHDAEQRRGDQNVGNPLFKQVIREGERARRWPAAYRRREAAQSFILIPRRKQQKDGTGRFLTPRGLFAKRGDFSTGRNRRSRDELSL